MKITKHTWPIMIVSGQFEAINDEGFRLREMVKELEEVQECSVLKSFSYEDAIEIFISRSDLGAVVIDWDIQSEDASENVSPEVLLEALRKRNKKIPVLLLTDRLATENIPTRGTAAH